MPALTVTLLLALPAAGATAKTSPDIDPTWSADGKHVAFARLRAETDVDTSASIWIVGRDGRGARQVTPVSDPSYFNRPAWTPDGAWLSIQVSARYSQPTTDVVRIEGRDLTPIHDAGGASVEALRSAWSPDGRHLALVGTTGIHLAERDAWEARPLTRGSGYPSWSPDSSRIVLASAGALAIVDVGSGAVTQLPAPRALASWAPRGPLIAYATGCEAGVVSASAVGKPPRRKPCGENATGSVPSWSPDARRFAYSRCINASCRVYVASAARPSRAKIVARGKDPAWSPDGRRIAYARTVGNSFVGIWLIYPNGAGAHPLLH